MSDEVRLIVQDEQMLSALASAERFRARYGADVAGHLELTRGVVRDTLGFLRTVAADPPWGGYLCVSGSSGEVVGCGSFKGGPDAEGCVEIAYYTFPSFEGRGHATETARALLSIAKAQADAAAVIACTLPETNASTRILGKLGFERAGEAHDPDEGTVWLWRRALRPS